MTQNEKDILFKDLCARLPYGVKCEVYNCIGVLDEVTTLYGVGVTYSNGQDTTCRIDECKPYLFPLSNMTEEQYKEWGDLAGEPLDEILTRNAKGEIMSTLEHHLLVAKSSTEPVNYCYKNHFDINGLIPMGIAIDATGKNIY